MAYDLTRFFDTLRIRLPGALDGVIYLEMTNAIEEFCTGSNSYQEDIPLTTVNGVSDYAISSADTGMDVFRLAFIYDTEQIPVDGYMPTPGIVRLSVTPTSSGKVYACSCALSPKEITSGNYPVMPDWWWGQYQPNILDGVLGKMMSQPAKPYSNLQLARYHAKRFTQGINQAKTQTQHGNNFRGQNWRFPGGFA